MKVKFSKSPLGMPHTAVFSPRTLAGRRPGAGPGSGWVMQNQSFVLGFIPEKNKTKTSIYSLYQNVISRTV